MLESNYDWHTPCLSSEDLLSKIVDAVSVPLKITVGAYSFFFLSPLL